MPPTIRRRLSRPSRDADGGASALELAVIGPTLIIIIFFAIQLGLYLYGRSVALQAAREGVTQLRLAQTYDQCEATEGAVKKDAESFADSIGGASLDGAQATPDCSQFNDAELPQVSVTVQGTAVSLVPFLWKPGITQKASGAIEVFVQPPPGG